MKTCLIVDPAGKLFGSERALLDLLPHFSSYGWGVAVSAPPGELLDKVADEGVKVFPLPAGDLHLGGYRRRIAAIGAMTAIVKRAAPSVLHVNQAGFTAVAALASLPWSVPVVSHLRLFEDIEYLRDRWYRLPGLRGVICISESLASAARENLPATHLATVYDGYQLTTVQGTAPSAVQVSPVFACLSRLVPGKGQELLLDAVERLRLANRGVRLRMATGGAPSEAYKLDLIQRCKTRGLDDAIEWREPSEGIHAFLEGTSGLVCPSWVEALGRVVFEAWDAGVVPIAWRRSGGPAEIITSSRGGVLYDEQDGECLARTLTDVAEMGTRQKTQMVRAGRTWMEEHCDPRGSAGGVVAVWERAAGGARRGRDGPEREGPGDGSGRTDRLRCGSGAGTP